MSGGQGQPSSALSPTSALIGVYFSPRRRDTSPTVNPAVYQTIFFPVPQNRMGFQADLPFGEMYQNRLLDYLTLQDGDEIEQPLGNFKEYDVLWRSGSTVTTYEVKADRITQRTGNLCIEYECRGKPSGITTTTANYWVHFVVQGPTEHTCYIIPTDIIRSIMNSYPSRNVGDGWKTKARLIPLAIFAQYKATPQPSDSYHLIDS